MTDAWQIAAENFREDDGSLPGIEFTELDARSVTRVFEYFRVNGQCVSEDPTVWDEAVQDNVPLLPITDPCQFIHDGRVHSFHCCFGGIAMEGITIPVLGVFVFQNCIEIDFKMGLDWNPRNIDAFFKLLVHLKSLAPDAIIRSARSEGLMNEESFLAALKLYLPHDLT